MGTVQATATAPSNDEAKNHILKRYETRIAYYWKASKYNKRCYKTTRFLLIALGALVTLISSVSAAGSVPGGSGTALKIATPVLAATLAIIGGISQAFQWGAAWSDQVITAMRLETERDRVIVTPASQLDPIKELALLDNLVLAETQGFFQRLFGSGGPTKSDGQSTT
ncbi:MAG: DUF4231 domain-containing protein [Bryobacteraceae bacterium]|jgi:hypothetical protein